MSFVDTSRLRGLLDPTLSFFTTTLPFTTTVLTIDSLTQYQAYIRAFRIVNNDGAAIVTFRQGGRQEPSKTVPISSEVSSVGWESFIEITPNAVTGSGFIELDLVPRDKAVFQ